MAWKVPGSKTVNISYATSLQSVVYTFNNILYNKLLYMVKGLNMSQGTTTLLPGNYGTGT